MKVVPFEWHKGFWIFELMIVNKRGENSLEYAIVCFFILFWIILFVVICK